MGRVTPAVHTSTPLIFPLIFHPNLSPLSRPMRDEGKDQGKDKGADESRVGRINRSRHGADNAASPSSRVATTVNNWVNPSNSMTLYTGA